MDNSLITLCTTAAVIGFTHTLIGPDHYLPFIMLGKANNWSNKKIVIITILCGIGHVLSSVILGAVGIFLGLGLNKLISTESIRGNISFYLLVGFGTAYAMWGVRYAIRKTSAAKQLHTHNGENFNHHHLHLIGHKHVHEDNPNTIWAIFIIFVLGPCESLIPLLMFPAMMHGWHGVAVVSTIFGIVTITTMTLAVYVVYSGTKKLSSKWKWMETWSHALAGFAIAVSGLIIKIFGV